MGSEFSNSFNTSMGTYDFDVFNEIENPYRGLASTSSQTDFFSGSQPTGSSSWFSNISYGDIKAGADIFGLVVGGISQGKQYEGQRRLLEGQAEQYNLQGLSYEEQAAYELERADRESLKRELEGEFDYGEQVLQAQSTGFFSGSESFGEGTSSGTVIDATKNTYLQEADAIRKRGERLHDSYLRQAGASRGAAASAREQARIADKQAGRAKGRAFGSAAGAAIGTFALPGLGTAGGAAVGGLISDVTGGFFGVFD